MFNELGLFLRLLHCMVLILECNSEMGTLMRSDICYPICLRHLFRSRAVKNVIFSFLKVPIFLQTFATYSELPSIASSMTQGLFLLIMHREAIVYGRGLDTSCSYTLLLQIFNTINIFHISTCSIKER